MIPIYYCLIFLDYQSVCLFGIIYMIFIFDIRNSLSLIAGRITIYQHEIYKKIFFFFLVSLSILLN